MSEVPADWPFDQPPNCVAITTTQVLTDGHDITHVYHDEDDHGWQFHYSGEKSVSDSLVVLMKTVTAHDPTVMEVADLPIGWLAIRERRGEPWQRMKHE